MSDTQLYLKSQDINSKTFKTKDFIDIIRKDPNKFEMSMKSSISKFPGSKSYWAKMRKFLETIIKQKGMPTLFLTFSCADTHNLII